MTLENKIRESYTFKEAEEIIEFFKKHNLFKVFKNESDALEEIENIADSVSDLMVELKEKLEEYDL